VCDADVANLISKTLQVDSTVLTAVLFTQFGLTIGWKTQGTTANELSYTVSTAHGCWWPTGVTQSLEAAAAAAAT
jgi:hypothetical protein